MAAHNIPPIEPANCDGSPIKKNLTDARRYALHQRLKRYFAYTAKGRTIEIFGDKADIVPVRIRRVLNELKNNFGYQVQYVTYDTSPINTKPMFISFKKAGSEVILNLAEITAVRLTGTTLTFLGGVVLQGVQDGMQLYGLAVVEELTYTNEAEALRAHGIVNRALTPKKI